MSCVFLRLDKSEGHSPDSSLDNPTPAMLAVMSRMRDDVVTTRSGKRSRSERYGLRLWLHGGCIVKQIHYSIQFKFIFYYFYAKIKQIYRIKFVFHLEIPFPTRCVDGKTSRDIIL